MDVGVTFGLRLPLGQHPVPLCLRTKDAIPFRREGRREDMMKLRDLEKREEKKNSSENWYRTEKNTSRRRIENNFNHFASKRKKKEDEEGSWFWRMADKQEEEPSCFLASFFYLPFLSHYLLPYLSLSLSLSVSLPLLKWQQTPPTLGARHIFCLSWKSRARNCHCWWPEVKQTRFSLPQSIQLGNLTQEHPEFFRFFIYI